MLRKYVRHKYISMILQKHIGLIIYWAFPHTLISDRFAWYTMRQTSAMDRGNPCFWPDSINPCSMILRATCPRSWCFNNTAISNLKGKEILFFTMLKCIYLTWKQCSSTNSARQSAGTVLTSKWEKNLSKFIWLLLILTWGFIWSGDIFQNWPTRSHEVLQH